jgi:hypothetical protein
LGESRALPPIIIKIKIKIGGKTLKILDATRLSSADYN